VSIMLRASVCAGRGRGAATAGRARCFYGAHVEALRACAAPVTSWVAFLPGGIAVRRAKSEGAVRVLFTVATVLC
jgi:hypothetical protein